MSNAIIDYCNELAAEGLPISAVWAEPITANRYLISVSIPMFGSADEMGTPIVDQAKVPKGVTCREHTRYPDQTREIIANDEQVEAMISALAKYGQAQDWACFDDGKYLTKPNRWFPGANKEAE